jgi:hypothetical protein
VSRRGGARLAVALVSLALLTGGCHDSKPSARGGAANSTTATGAAATTSTTGVQLGPAIAFNAHNGRLAAYATTPPFTSQTVVPSPLADRDGVDVSGQICFDPTDPRRFVAVDRTAAADGQIGWGVFELAGQTLGKLSAKEVARLVPSYQPTIDRAGPAPYGCAFLADGRLLTTDVGNPTHGTVNGQLIEWFPPFDAERVPACKIAVDLAAPMGMLVADAQVYVAENRGRGITRFDSSTFPRSNRPGDGCAALDSTGHRLASAVGHSAWLQNTVVNGMRRPGAIAAAGNGNFFVSFPSTGVIAEVSGSGELVRRVLVPPGGAVLGPRPFSTGTPLGLGVTPDGTVYYADPGFVRRESRLVPKLRAGTVRRITFVAGVAQRPAVVDSGLQAPSGIGIWIPSA